MAHIGAKIGIGPLAERRIDRGDQARPARPIKREPRKERGRRKEGRARGTGKSGKRRTRLSDAGKAV